MKETTNLQELLKKYFQNDATVMELAGSDALRITLRFDANRGDLIVRGPNEVIDIMSNNLKKTPWFEKVMEETQKEIVDRDIHIKKLKEIITVMQLRYAIHYAAR